jgi:hypothetical protein
MDLKEVSSSFGIPLSVLRRMEKEGLLPCPLDEAGVRNLSFIGHLWGKKWFAGAVLRGIRSRRERILLALFPEYGRIEFYVLNTYLAVEEDEVISVASLQHRIKKSFSADFSEQRIRQLRQTAYDIRNGRFKLKTGSANISYAELLGLARNKE